MRFGSPDPYILPVCIMKAIVISTIAVRIIAPSVMPRGMPGEGGIVVVVSAA